MTSLIPDVPDVAPALEALRLALSPVEALAVALAAVALIGTLVYARRHHTGRCQSRPDMVSRQISEADQARSS